MNEDHIHQESRHFRKLQEYLGEFVYGGIDGAVTTFAVVAGGFGTDLDPGIIIILGFANGEARCAICREVHRNL